MESDINKGNSPISKRENQVIEGLSHGLSEKEIGEKLYISPKTVDRHLDNIKKKIGVTKNIEIVAYYIATLRGKKFDLKLLREYGISIFILFVHVYRLDV